jgi:NADH:ubiquinone oxidoreductase subunit 6 (subunit J)
MQALLRDNWAMLVPAALGMAALYLLLPRARRIPPLYGAATAALALLAAGWWMIHSEWILVERILFYTFAGLAVVFGGLMITQRNPVHAALCFAMVVLSTCGLFLLQAAPFLMAATIIVYAGAIVVTFLFVIMLAQQAGPSNADQRSREPFLACVAGFVLLGSLLCVLQQSYARPPADLLDKFIQKAELAQTVDSVKAWREIFGDNRAFFDEFRTQVGATWEYRKATKARRELSSAVQMAGLRWSSLLPSEDDPAREPSPAQVKEFKDELANVSTCAAQLRQSQGSLSPRGDLPLSTATGSAPHEIIPLTEDGKPRERLPASNVAGLGKALFTDYLLAVDLAGTLLLVATIGAIAIAGRRAEGLR